MQVRYGQHVNNVCGGGVPFNLHMGVGYAGTQAVWHVKHLSVSAHWGHVCGVRCAAVSYMVVLSVARGARELTHDSASACLTRAWTYVSCDHTRIRRSLPRSII